MVSSPNQPSFQFTLNGTAFDVPPELRNVALAEFIRCHTPFKSVKVACGEGGCGACTVAVAEEHEGVPSLRTINSCLAPVFSVRGCSVVTAEGLPKGASGASVVADRLTSFHASQCGYCTPGFTVACHAAVHNAAAAGGADGQAALGGPALRAALDGNLCRCTGYRPIVSAFKSFAAGGDIEDLGLHVPACANAGGCSATAACTGTGACSTSGACCGTSGCRPATLEQLPKELLEVAAVTGSAAAAPLEGAVPVGPSQELHCPASLDQLLELVRGLVEHQQQQGEGGGSWRVVAGNTAHGIYKDWPSERTLVAIAKVPELKVLSLEGPEPSQELSVGACVTLSELAAFLEHKIQGGGKAAAAEGGARAWAAESAAHLSRIAGRHVRNAATVGGNVALCRERALPSDVATLLAAAGTEVELALLGPGTAGQDGQHRLWRLPLIDFVSGGWPKDAPPEPQPYLVTRLVVPLPGPGVRFWSQRIAQRYSNAAAVANVAVWARVSAEAATVEEVRVVVGVRTPPESSSTCRKAVDVTSVVLDGWRCLRATGAEAALQGRAPTPGAVADALAALTSSDLAAVLPGAGKAPHRHGDENALLALLASSAPTAGEEEAAVAALAEGLVAQGLMACLLGQPAGEAPANGSPAAAADGSKMPPPALVHGRQHFPAPVPELAPVTQPVTKWGGALQAGGTAQYAEDTPIHKGALYAAYVLSSCARAALLRVDASAALALPGVVRFIGAGDLPPGATNFHEADNGGEREPVFASDRVLFAGQPIGLVLAEGPSAAIRGAKAVVVEYGPLADDPGKEPQGAIMTLAEALETGSMYPVAAMFASMPAGGSFGEKNSVMAVAPVGGKGMETGGVLAAAGVAPAAAALLQALGSTVSATAGRVGEAKAEALAAMAAAVAAAESQGGEAGVVAAAAAADAAQVGKANGVHAVAPAGPEDVEGSDVANGQGNGHTAGAGAPVVVRGMYALPSQMHFYMETQTAVATPDEDGGMLVQSACQGTDVIQSGVAIALGLPHNKVTVRCRRVGGGFGGKATLSRRVAAAAALAAAVTGRQVRLSVPRNADLAMTGGRCSALVSYVAIVDDPRVGTLHALDVSMLLQAGAYPDIAFVDIYGISAAIDSVYHLPHLRVEMGLARCNVPPRTATRGPGEIEGVMVIEQVLEHVASRLGLEPEAVRQANFLKSCSEPAAAPAEGAEPQEVVVTTLGKRMSAHMYSLPKMWADLQAAADWQQRQADVAAFNKAHMWRKRALAMVPCRYAMSGGKKPAYVSVYADGTVLVACHGVEMGQGLFTKVRQTAAYTLGEALPPGKGPLSMDLIRIADNSSELLPNSGVTGGSTTSEQACAAVRLACRQLANNMVKAAEAKLAGKEGDYEWMDLVKACLGAWGPIAPMSAYVFGAQSDLPECGPDAPLGPPPAMYHTFGCAAVEVEVDALSGERRVLRADVMFDLGRPCNSAVDIGQVEGAFVQGLGMMLSEEVSYATGEEQGAGGGGVSLGGGMLNNSTWNYKVPAATCAPQQLNVHLMEKAPLTADGPVSAKAVGEPPLLLSAGALVALQRATAAAREHIESVLASGGGSGTVDAAAANSAAGAVACGKEEFEPLLAPATVERVRAACGNWRAQDVLRALQGSS